VLLEGCGVTLEQAVVITEALMRSGWTVSYAPTLDEWEAIRTLLSTGKQASQFTHEDLDLLDDAATNFAENPPYRGVEETNRLRDRIAAFLPPRHIPPLAPNN
jgi:hypothetical protein